MSIPPPDQPIRMGLWPMLASTVSFFAIGLISASTVFTVQSSGRVPWTFSLIPVLGALAFFAPTRLVRGKARLMIPAFVVQAGLLTIMVVWMFFTGTGGRGWIEDIAFGLGVALLIGVQHWWPAVPLILYQLWATAVALGTLPSVKPGEGGLRTLVLTVIAFRILAAILMVVGIVRYSSGEQTGTVLRAAGEATPVSAAIPDPGESTTDRTVEELRRLAVLAQEGVITQEEFAASKRRILGL